MATPVPFSLPPRLFPFSSSPLSLPIYSSSLPSPFPCSLSSFPLLSLQTGRDETQGVQVKQCYLLTMRAIPERFRDVS